MNDDANTPPLGAREIAKRISQGDLSCEEVAQDCLQRIAAAEPSIEAWQFLDPEHVLHAARALDRYASRSDCTLLGVPVGVKDVFDTADMPTSYGSHAYQGFQPSSDASVVALLRRCGGLVMGKTVTTEFAAVSPGKTKNPHNKSHTPGGSSSGSAAAVAAGMVPIALGTQTSGSTIRPASYCGVIGYKPTFDLINRSGLKALASSLDTIGVLARSVADVAFFTSVVTSRPDLVSHSTSSNARIGIYKTPHWDRADTDVHTAMDRSIDRLSKSGFVLRDVSNAPRFDRLLALHDTIIAYEVSRSLAFERFFRSDSITEQTLAFIESGARLSPDAYDAARQEVRTLQARLDDLFGDCDILLTPASTGPAPRGLESTGDPIFNRGWTLLHVPCVTLPIHKGDHGLPVGVQFVGRLNEDSRLLAICATAERVLAS